MWDDRDVIGGYDILLLLSVALLKERCGGVEIIGILTDNASIVLYVVVSLIVRTVTILAELDHKTALLMWTVICDFVAAIHFLFELNGV